ncbi:MAG: ABC-2 transporter permease [Clostridiales bacterium]|nr:ABC-2 transporter permease [Clostridiales bacterium]
MKLLMKEWKLCMHPMGYIMLLCSALILVPGYPYGVSCFYMGLAIYFICLTARENHDAGFTLTLPVSRRDAVRARILFCALLEVIDLALIGVFVLIKYLTGGPENPAGLDAGLALIGEAMILFALFNLIFFPLYYRDINKPGKAFMFASAAVFGWIILEIAATYTIDFVQNVLDHADGKNIGDKALFTLGGLALFLAGTAKSIQSSAKHFEETDLSL